MEQKYRTTASTVLCMVVGDLEPTNCSRDLEIAIIGGGIGGMSLALSLVDAGFHGVNIYESVDEIKEIGVGINIQPHAVRELIELGLGDELAKAGIPTAEICYFHNNGQFIYREPRGVAAGYIWPQYSINRGELLGILHRAVVSRLGKDRIHLGHKATDCGQCEKGGAWVEFTVRGCARCSTSSSEPEDTQNMSKKIEAGVIVACDGVHSNVRKVLTNEGAPTWMGITMLRGLTRMKPFLSGRTMTIIGSIERQMVIYPISKAAEDKGESIVNWVALIKTSEEEKCIGKEAWDVKVRDIDKAIEPFADFKFNFIDVPKLIRCAENVYQYPMIDRPPLETWVYGNITLLGDAAHPMIPIGANGGTQAIIDGRVLALELARQPSLHTALAAYDARRREVVNRIVKANRDESETRFLELIHEKCPDGFTSLEGIITEEELHDISLSYKKVAGFEPEVLNTRGSYSAKNE